MTDRPTPTALRTLTLTAIAMVAFAANSLLTRLALAPGDIDAASFGTIRVISGAVTLYLILALTGGGKASESGANWRSAAMLFTYVALFSFAYITLSAGTGALILFGTVQITMFIVALREGEHFPLLSWIGFVMAFGGLVYLVSPGVTAPDPLGAGLMTVAGIAWGVYSLLGRGVSNPLGATARNFALSVPLVIAVSLIFHQSFAISTGGLILAIASGALASGCGYVIWYAALPGLTATRAATVQLSVPVIAAFGGVIFISEEVTLRLILASAVTLGGVAIVLAQRAAKPAARD